MRVGDTHTEVPGGRERKHPSIREALPQQTPRGAENSRPPTEPGPSGPTLTPRPGGLCFAVKELEEVGMH